MIFEEEPITILVPTLTSLLAGYFAIFTLQAIGMFLTARFAGRQLIHDGCLHSRYFALLITTWFVASLASGYVTTYLAPFAPYGPHVFCAIMACIAAALFFRNDHELPTHQPLAVTISVFAVVAAGFAAGDLLSPHA